MYVSMCVNVCVFVWATAARHHTLSPPPTVACLKQARHGSVPGTEAYLALQAATCSSPPPPRYTRHASLPEEYLYHTPQVPD